MESIGACKGPTHAISCGIKQTYKCAFHDEADCNYRIQLVLVLGSCTIRIGDYGHSNHGSDLFCKACGAPTKYMKTRFNQLEDFADNTPKEAVDFLNETMSDELNSAEKPEVFDELSEIQIRKFKRWFSVRKSVLGKNSRGEEYVFNL
jgi:hypothetical protein